jgi:hypothetical protein
MPSTSSATPPVLRTEIHNSGSYSLLLLFYVTTMAAVVIAAGRFAFESSEINWRIVGWSAAIITVVGWMLGSTIGWILARRSMGLLLGSMVGVTVGMLASCFAMILPNQFLSANLLVFSGSWILIVVALLASRTRRVQISGRR